MEKETWRERAAVLGAALWAPWRVWPRLIAERRDAIAVYFWVAAESLLLRPEESVRAGWAVARRGAGAAMGLLRLASLQVLWLIGFCAVFALCVRAAALARRQAAAHTGGLGFGEVMALAPWAYAPKLLASALFALGCALGVVPAEALSVAALRAGRPWAVGYQVTCVILIGASAMAFFRASSKAAALPPVPRRFSLGTLALCIGFLAAGAGFTWRAARDPQRFRPVGRGDLVQALSLPPLSPSSDAPPLELGFPLGEPVLIDFWASWCGPCVDALPGWSRLVESDGQQALLVSANVETDSLDDVKKFIHDHGLTFPVHAASPALQARFQVDTLPTTVLLSADGAVREYWVGSVSEETMRTALRDALLHSARAH